MTTKIIDDLERMDIDTINQTPIFILILLPSDSVSLTVAICDVMKRLKHKVVTIGMGQVASGSVLNAGIIWLLLFLVSCLDL